MKNKKIFFATSLITLSILTMTTLPIFSGNVNSSYIENDLETNATESNNQEVSTMSNGNEHGELTQVLVAPIEAANTDLVNYTDVQFEVDWNGSPWVTVTYEEELKQEQLIVFDTFSNTGEHLDIVEITLTEGVETTVNTRSGTNVWGLMSIVMYGNTIRFHVADTISSHDSVGHVNIGNVRTQEIDDVSNIYTGSKSEEYALHSTNFSNSAKEEIVTLSKGDTIMPGDSLIIRVHGAETSRIDSVKFNQKYYIYDFYGNQAGHFYILNNDQIKIYTKSNANEYEIAFYQIRKSPFSIPYFDLYTPKSSYESGANPSKIDIGELTYYRNDLTYNIDPNLVESKVSFDSLNLYTLLSPVYLSFIELNKYINDDDRHSMYFERIREYDENGKQIENYYATHTTEIMEMGVNPKHSYRITVRFKIGGSKWFYTDFMVTFKG